MDKLLQKFHCEITEEEVKNAIDRINEEIEEYLEDEDVLYEIFGMIDLTSLNTTDSEKRITEMVRKTNNFREEYRQFPNVAAICVYPNFVETVEKNLELLDVSVASVVGGFPSSQTFTSVKIAETQAAVDAGADEVDMVLSVGEFLQGNYEKVAEEIKAIKKAASDAHVKVILETGALETVENIWNASILAMDAGADFIKTSTGKMQPAATPQAAYVMIEAIKVFFENTGKRTGFKPAGGIRTPEQAAVYYALVNEYLGDEWLNPELFRFGASSLANNIIAKITGKQNNYF